VAREHEGFLDSSADGEHVLICCRCSWGVDLGWRPSPEAAAEAWRAHLRQVRDERKAKKARSHALRLTRIRKARDEGLKKLTPEERQALGI